MKDLFNSSVCLALTVVLTACGGSSNSDLNTNTNARCSATSGSTLLVGTVTAVHDGDTLTLTTDTSTEHIRLQGIDAPELAQPFGDNARVTLTQQTLHQSVRVAYTQRDRYDRILGQVFTSNCVDVNQQLLNLGMAWFYKAYACDLEKPRRTRYEAAHAQALAQGLGLWSKHLPLAPWIFRNGEDPPTPNCAD
jgi:endonuclease YncB( thermonuclease family)